MFGSLTEPFNLLKQMMSVIHGKCMLKVPNDFHWLLIIKAANIDTYQILTVEKFSSRLCD